MIPNYYQDITLGFRLLVVMLIFLISNIAFVRSQKWHFANVSFYIAGLMISVLWDNYFINFSEITPFILLVIVLDLIPFIILYSFPFMREGRRIS